MYNELYLIEILHQTTTRPSLSWLLLRCILSKFYIKPQLVPNSTDTSYGCILSKFYIKPQQRVRHTLGHSVVSYRNSTSNHNLWTTKSASEMLYLIEILHQTTTTSKQSKESKTLYLIEILHQTTTLRHDLFNIYCCILSKFYIKPQQRVRHTLGHSVVSYRNSTSNHNIRFSPPFFSWLYLIEILHQTTTHMLFFSLARMLYLIEILHQTTT